MLLQNAYSVSLNQIPSCGPLIQWEQMTLWCYRRTETSGMRSVRESSPVLSTCSLSSWEWRLSSATIKTSLELVTEMAQEIANEQVFPQLKVYTHWRERVWCSMFLNRFFKKWVVVKFPFPSCLEGPTAPMHPTILNHAHFQPNCVSDT